MSNETSAARRNRRERYLASESVTLWMYGRGVAGAQVDLGGVRNLLSGMRHRRATLRAMYLRTSQGFQLGYAEIFVGPPPSSWKDDQSWVYDECAFVSRTTTVATLQKALDIEELSEPIDFGPISSVLGAMQGGYIVNHHPSFRQNDEHRYSWSSWEIRLSLNGVQNLQLPQDFLMAPNAPSFPSVSVAFRAFFFGDFRYTGTINPPIGEAKIRIADQRGRIARVFPESSRLSIQIGGRALKGCQLEFFSNTYRPTVDVNGPGTITVPLPSGMPSEAWLWLKSGSEWLDYCYMSAQRGVADFRIDERESEDPEADVGALIAQGEGEYLEFKVQLPASKSIEERRNVLKTVTAFAVGRGGTILFGVQDKTGIVIGLDGSGDSLQRRFHDLMRHKIRPNPRVKTRIIQLGGKLLLIVEVLPSVGKLHALMLNPDVPEYYVRRGSTTFHAQPDELEAAINLGNDGISPELQVYKAFG